VAPNPSEFGSTVAKVLSGGESRPHAVL